MKIEKNKVEEWNGSYKGVSFQIKHWKTDPNEIEPNGSDHWTYYLILHLDRIPEKYNPKSFWLKPKKMNIGNRIWYDYYNHPIISDLHWHGGITWYSKERGFDGDLKIIKIGCDYSHLWDEGKVYDLDYLINDVKISIERFKELIPDYKYWCCGNGKLYDLSEGIIKNEKFYSKEYFGNKDWYKKLKGA